MLQNRLPLLPPEPRAHARTRCGIAGPAVVQPSRVGAACPATITSPRRGAGHPDWPVGERTAAATAAKAAASITLPRLAGTTSAASRKAGRRACRSATRSRSENPPSHQDRAVVGVHHAAGEGPRLLHANHCTPEGLVTPACRFPPRRRRPRPQRRPVRLGAGGLEGGSAVAAGTGSVGDAVGPAARRARKRSRSLCRARGRRRSPCHAASADPTRSLPPSRIACAVEAVPSVTQQIKLRVVRWRPQDWIGGSGSCGVPRWPRGLQAAAP